jgi:hypothetical protein
MSPMAAEALHVAATKGTKRARAILALKSKYAVLCHHKERTVKLSYPGNL